MGSECGCQSWHPLVGAAVGLGSWREGREAVSWLCALLQEGVSREFIRERQHRERLGWLQGGTKSTTKGMKQQHPEPWPPSSRESGQGDQPFPFVFFRTANA